MTDDNTDAEDEEQAVTLNDAIDFASDRAGEESDGFEGDVPNHAGRLLAKRAADLGATITNIQMARANENAPDIEDEGVAEALSEDAVDIIMALGALDHEYGLDIAGKFEERMELISAYKDFTDAVEDAETQEDIMEAVDEHMTEELEQTMGGGQPMGQAPTIEPGDNVDAEEYEHEDVNKGVQ
jgi:hypothetical protein